MSIRSKRGFILDITLTSAAPTASGKKYTDRTYYCENRQAIQDILFITAMDNWSEKKGAMPVSRAKVVETFYANGDTFRVYGDATFPAASALKERVKKLAERLTASKKDKKPASAKKAPKPAAKTVAKACK